MRLRNPREINEPLTMFGQPMWSIAAAIVSVPMTFMFIDLLALVVSAALLALGAAISTLPKGFLIHRMYSWGILDGIFVGTPAGAVKKYRE